MVEHERTGPLDLLTWTFSRITMWAPAFIVAIIFYEVVMRYIFFRPTLWVNELSLWVAGAIYLAAGLYSMQQRSHIRIFILYDLAPRWMRKLFDVISAVCVSIFAFAVIWGGYGEATAKFLRWERFGTAFDPPIPATTKPLVLIMVFFLTLQVTSNLIRDWPAAGWVRKLFDITVTAVIVALAGYTFYNIAIAPPEGMVVPTVWIVGISIFLIISMAIVIIGLVMDFNRTPVPHIENSDPAEEAAQTVAEIEQSLTSEKKD